MAKIETGGSAAADDHLGRWRPVVYRAVRADGAEVSRHKY